ncbi:MAG TPA: hypothetical protein VJ892_00230 [Candidatus Absconditabacterales bacterium]|nr:hypothetical protein [Candidatus Absconditabacterales bacterium]
MNKELSLKDQLTDFLLYTTPNGNIKEKSVISILETTAEDSKNYQIKFYNKTQSIE